MQVASTSTYPMENISPAPPATPVHNGLTVATQPTPGCDDGAGPYPTPSPFALPTTPYPNFQGYHGAQHPPEMSAVYPQLAGQGLFPPEQRPPLHELQPASQPPPSLHEMQPASQPPPSLYELQPASQPPPSLHELQPPSQPPPSLHELQPPSQGSEESEHSANDDHTEAEEREEETAPALTGEHTPAATATPKRASTTMDATPSAAAVPKVHLLFTRFPQYFAFTPITSHNIVHTFTVHTYYMIIANLVIDTVRHECT